MTTTPAAVAPQPRHVAPKKAAAEKTPTRKKAPPKPKGETILHLVGRRGGATMAQIVAATGWQAHSVRGFISVQKKHGVKIESAKNAKGERIYRIVRRKGK
jgi:hypothetical protein